MLLCSGAFAPLAPIPNSFFCTSDPRRWALRSSTHPTPPLASWAVLCSCPANSKYKRLRLRLWTHCRNTTDAFTSSFEAQASLHMSPTRCLTFTSLLSLYISMCSSDDEDDVFCFLNFTNLRLALSRLNVSLFMVPLLMLLIVNVKQVSFPFISILDRRPSQCR